MKSTDTIHETLFQYYILRYAFGDISHLHMEKSLPNMECSKSVRVLTCIRFRRLHTFNLGTRSPQVIIIKLLRFQLNKIWTRLHVESYINNAMGQRKFAIICIIALRYNV